MMMENYGVQIEKLTAQRDTLLEILKAIQDGQEMTPEFCRHIDAVIEEIETTKLKQQEKTQ